MIANYGYQDGSGEYFITIDTGCCLTCEGRWCVEACPQQLFAIEMDDYDDEVAVIVEAARKQLKELCACCKGQNGSGRSRTQASLHHGVCGGRPAAQLVTAVRPRRTLDVRVDGETVTVDEEGHRSGGLRRGRPLCSPPVPTIPVWPAARWPRRGASASGSVECGLCAVRAGDGAVVLACNTPVKAGHRCAHRR